MAVLTDYHFHTEISRDSQAPWFDMVMAEYNAGARYLCVTDHCDTVDWMTMELQDIYLTDLQRVAELDYFDVMAHIGYWRRYAWQQRVDEALTLAKHGDRVERLLKTLIGNGRGIEINCSGIRDGCGPFPSEEILRLYRSLGGEIITIGSDAHRPADAAKCVDAGQELLKNIGFRYFTVFTKRKPEFIPII